MDIRPLPRTETRELAPQMVALIRESYARPPHAYDMPEDQAAASIREIVEDPHAVIIGALDAVQLVYFTASRILARSHPFGHRLSPWLAGIGADPAKVLLTPYAGIAAAWRGKGVAVAASPVLDREIERLGLSMRIIAVVVGRAGGERSQHTFYERIGYRPVPIEDTVTGKPEKRVRYYFKGASDA